MPFYIQESLVKLKTIFNNKSVSLIGAGVSNTPLAEKLIPICSKLTVRDRKDIGMLGETAEKLISVGAELITGEDYLKSLDEDIILRSPGIRPDIPEFEEARKRGSIVTTEVEIFLSKRPCPVFAITGSDGKTTTTTIASLLIEPKGKVILGGNIGDPLLYRIDDVSTKDAAVLELSSFQLMDADFEAEASAITNITPNHLNWHTGMDEYTEAKKRILRHAKKAVLNYDNDATRSIAFELIDNGFTGVTLFSLSPIPEIDLARVPSAFWLEDGTIVKWCGNEKTKILKRSSIKLPGLHNVANYMTAIALVDGHTSAERIENVACTFGGVEHRLEFVRFLDGVTYINGSIDSSPTRTAAALSAIDDRPVVLIAGGYDKHIPYEPLADAIMNSSVHTVVLTGATAGKILSALKDALERSPDHRPITIVNEPDFEEAVKKARDAARPGDTVILSPASASFDMFPNFEVRGRRFKDIVNSF